VVLTAIAKQIDSGSASKDVREKLSQLLNIKPDANSKEVIAKLLADYEALRAAQEAVTKAESDNTAATLGAARAKLVLAGAMSTAAGVLEDYEKKTSKLAQSELDAVLDTDAKAMLDLTRAAETLSTEYNKLKESRTNLLKSAHNSDTFGTNAVKDADKQVKDIDAAMAKISAALAANRERQTKATEEAAKKQTDIQREAQEELIKIQTDTLRKNGQLREADEKEAKLKYEKEVDRINKIKGLTEAMRTELLNAAKTYYQAERNEIDTNDRKRFASTEEGKRLAKQLKDAEEDRLKLIEIADLRQRIEQAVRLNDVREELRLRRELVKAVESLNSEQAKSVEKDKESQRAVDLRLDSLEEELRVRRQLDPKGVGGAVRDAQRDLIGTDDPAKFRDAARKTLGEEESQEGINKRVRGVIRTLELEYQEAERQRLEARRKRDREAENEAIRIQREIAEKYRILVNEQERARKNLETQNRNTGAGDPNSPNFIGPPAPVKNVNFDPKLNRGSPLGGFGGDGAPQDEMGPPLPPGFVRPGEPGAPSPNDTGKRLTDAGNSLTKAASTLQDNFDKLQESMLENVQTVLDTITAISDKVTDAVDVLNQNTAAIDSIMQDTQLLQIEGRIADYQ
jgi:hypothetical protein